MNFYTTTMENTSTRKDVVNSIRITVSDALNRQDVKGTASMLSFDNIWLDLPEKSGRYSLTAKAQKEMLKHHIADLDDLWHKRWLADGDWILRNLQPVEAAA